MSGDLGSLVISLTAETAQFKDSLTKAAYQMDQNMGQMMSATKGLEKSLGQVDATLGAFGINLRALFGLAAAGGLAKLISDSISAADRIHDLAEQTGIAAGELAAMRSAAAQGGVTLEEVAKASTKFSKAIETQNDDSGAASKALAALGLSMEEVKAHSPAEQLHIVAERLNTFADGSGKAAVAQVLFGKSGVEVLPFLKTYGEQVETTKEGYEDFANGADKFHDSLARLKIASQDIAGAYANALLPSLIAVVEGFEKLNAGRGSTVGFMDAVGEAVRVLALGFVTLWTAVKNLTTDLVTGAQVAFYAATGQFGKMYLAIAEGTEKTNANTAALRAFAERAMAGSKVFGDTATAVDKVGTSADNVKPKINLAAQEIDKVKEAAEKWIKTLQDNIAKLGLTEEAILRLQAREKGLGDTADALIRKFVDTKTALEAQKKAADEAAAAVKKLADEQAAFIKKLEDGIATSGLSEEATLKLQASQLGLGEETERLIRRYIDAKEAVANYTKAVADAKTEMDAYIAGQNAATDGAAKAVIAWHDGSRALSEQIDRIGLTKAEVDKLTAANQFESDRLKANLIEDRTQRESFLTFLREQYEKRLALIDSAEMRQAYIDNAEAAKKAAKETADAIEKSFKESSAAIEKSLEEAIFNGFRKGQSFAETFRNAVESMFKTLILRPILQPISNAMAGMYQQGSAYLSNLFAPGGALSMAGLFGFGGMGGGGGYLPDESMRSLAPAAMGGWSDILGAVAIGGALTSQYGSRSTMPGMIGGAGLMVGLAKTTGVVAVGAAAAATAAGASAAAAASIAGAVPVIGWIVAAAALLYSFLASPGGGPKQGGSAISSFDAAGNLTASRGNFYDSTVNQQDSALAKFTAAIGTSYVSAIKALGGKAANVAFGMGYDTDPEGTANNRLGTSVSVGGRQVYGFRDMELGRDNAVLQARMTVEAQRMLLAALQASELPQDVANLLNHLSPAALGADQIQNVIAYAAAFHSLPEQLQAALAGIDGLSINPATSANLAAFGAALAAVQEIVSADVGADVQAMLEASNQTAIEKFVAQGQALRTMATEFDGSATAALNLAQATAQYYQNMVQLLAALEQSTAVFHQSIQSLQESFLLDTLSSAQKLSYYFADFQERMAFLASATANPATADPAAVAAAAERARQDLQAQWALLSEAERRAQLGDYQAALGRLDQQLAVANAAIAASITEQNNPNNPNSPIGAVKGAFDRFMLDMGAWLEQNKGVAQSQTDAASTMSSAADTMAAAGAVQLEAANTPLTINMNSGTSEAGA